MWDFLKYYPECKGEFSQFREQMHMFTNTLYKNYVSCYIKKEKPLIEFSSQYRTHMFKIHEQFLSELRGKKLFVNNIRLVRLTFCLTLLRWLNSLLCKWLNRMNRNNNITITIKLCCIV